MKLAELTVTGFADIVSSDAPAPGGGSCAALYGAIGAALTAMVGGLTQGRKKYAEYAEHAAEVENYVLYVFVHNIVFCFRVASGV